MPTDLWRKSLKTLQKRFEAGAQQYPLLRCELIHAGPDEGDRIKERLQLQQFGQSIGGGFGVYEKADTPKKYSWRGHYFVGAKDGVALFTSLAKDAGRSLHSIPDHIVDETPKLSRCARAPLDAWVWTVFELAW